MKKTTKRKNDVRVSLFFYIKMTVERMRETFDRHKFVYIHIRQHLSEYDRIISVDRSTADVA